MLQAILGIFVLVFIAWLFSENKRKIDFRIIILGILCQFIIALLILKVPVFKNIFLNLNKMLLVIEEATREGTSFVFGYLGGGKPPFDEKFPMSSYILAFRALPLVLVMSALSSLLFYWKILPVIVKGFSFLLQKTFRIGGAEGLGVASNIFVGQVESPLLIRPYLKNMTRSEIFSVMTCGMAGIAGTMMVIYANILGPVIPDALGHILTASIISAPASVLIAKVMVPETEPITVSGEMVHEEDVKSSMDALTKGTTQGLQLLLNIIAMIIVILAVVYLINSIIGLLPDVYGKPVTLQRIFGIILSPVAWLLGIPWDECLTSGSLLGTKTVLNEFIAYLDMSMLEKGALSDRSLVIMTYALCGFANPGSLGIMIAGMGTMVPERKNEIVSMGMRSIVSGTLATCMTGAVVGILY
ncbi:MAG: nucleoside transporter C-terminal domain-containing protein [Spirochaetota bacterium]